jgi:hypothetical protein
LALVGSPENTAAAVVRFPPPNLTSVQQHAPTGFQSASKKFQPLSYQTFAAVGPLRQ